MMTTFVAHTLTETNVTEDRCRFELTFVDASGERHAISIPIDIVADLIPVLESVAAYQQKRPDFTRVPQKFAVGHALGDRLVLLRFDGEAPYALGVEVADELARELQEQSERISLVKRPGLH